MNGRHAWTGGWWNRPIRGGAASAMRPHASTPSAPGRTVAGWDRGAAPGSGADGLPGGLQESGVRTRSTAGRRELRLPARRPARLVRGRTSEDVRGRDGTVGGHDRSASDPTLGWPPTRRAEWLVWKCPAVAGVEPPGDRRCEVCALRRRDGASSRSELAARLALVRGGAPADVQSQADPRRPRDSTAHKLARSPGRTQCPLAQPPTLSRIPSSKL